MQYMGHHLEYIICPGRFPEPKFKDLYLGIYTCWQDVWSATFKELDGLDRLHSDAFTRQDFIGAILVDGECKAMALFRYADASLPTMKDDSYFSNWNEMHRHKLCQQGKKILVCSYFTIHSSARKETLGFAMRDLLIGLTSTVILHTEMDAMTSAARKNRNVEKLTYDWGAIPIAIDVPSGHGPDVFVDLAAFYKKQVSQAREQHEITAVVDTLWDHRTVIECLPPEDISHFSHGATTIFKKAA